MDKDYDLTNARIALDLLCEEHFEDETDGWLSSLMDAQPSWEQDHKIQGFKNLKSWHLVKETSDKGTIEEAVFKVRGILALKDLPPLEETPKTAVSCYKYLCQAVGEAITHCVTDLRSKQKPNITWLEAQILHTDLVTVIITDIPLTNAAAKEHRLANTVSWNQRAKDVWDIYQDLTTKKK
ncbi:hypothetical protein L208DRAFT_1377360 [Tricholoma matsutake]|nr:hypothetical protein L208DRAFT_1377360 [Tricholoma matsutake 945]